MTAWLFKTSTPKLKYASAFVKNALVCDCVIEVFCWIYCTALLIDNYERDDTSPELVLENLKKADVDEFVDVINADSIECSERYDNGQLDFIFLDTDSPGEYLKSELEVWYPKLKAGGILAGYDHTIHDTVFKSLDCVSSDFCSGKKIPLRTYEYQFIIQKPEAI